MGEQINQHQFQKNECLIKSLLILYVKKDNLKADFFIHMQYLIGQMSGMGDHKNMTKEANQYLEIAKANEIILEKFQKSTLKNWCIIISEIILKITLLAMASIVTKGLEECNKCEEITLTTNDTYETQESVEVGKKWKKWKRSEKKLQNTQWYFDIDDCSRLGRKSFYSTHWAVTIAKIAERKCSTL